MTVPNENGSYDVVCSLDPMIYIYIYIYEYLSIHLHLWFLWWCVEFFSHRDKVSGIWYK